ncbi:MAG: acyloxyacyl hydrolase [Fimbriimonadaceae bacterium]|nr:acyloxyacyl hydrolase [Fimbriimonadaceae bacterium]
MIPVAWSAIVAVALSVPPEDEPTVHRYLSVGYLFSARTLGSEDPRLGYVAMVGWGRPERRFRIKKNVPEAILSAYVAPSRSRGYVDIDPDSSLSLGASLIARYRVPLWRGAPTFLDVGWGVEYTNRITSDQPSQWNSTPILGLGFDVRLFGRESFVTARWHHASNAGTVGNNPGWNQIWLLVGFRW